MAVPDVDVLVPWSPRSEWRVRAWGFVSERYHDRWPDWRIVVGSTDVEGFSRTQAIIDARSRSTADILVVADADVWCDGVADAVAHVAANGSWAVPHGLIHRLSPESTEKVYAGADWRGLPLSTDNEQDRHPYRGHEAGTLLVLSADAFGCAPPDPRFVAWGGEDMAWALALHTLVGKPWRGDADLVHLWHPAEPRRTRVIGNESNLALLRRYRAASGDPAQMRQLIAEHATAAV